MSRSPHVTRRQTRSHRDDGDGDSDDSQDRSYGSSRSRQNDSLYSSASIQRSRNDSSSNDPDRTAYSSFLSDSPDRLYPDISGELNESGDNSYTRINEKKVRKLYPKLEISTNTASPSKSGSSTGNGNFFQTVSIFLVIFFFIVGVLVYLNTANASTDSDLNKSKSGYAFFEDEIKTLKDSFPSQTNRFWTTLSASALHVFEQQDPCYPSVILMASQNRHKQLNTCLAKKIASTFSSSFGRNSQISAVGTDVEDFKHMNAAEQKLYLDNTMQKAFQQEGGKAFVISNVHSLSPKAALLLHGFCDGDNAPFKDVMIILTFQVDDGITFTSVKEVERFLTDIWSTGLDMDKLSALMSRVANNPVVLMAENESTVNNLCS